MKTIIIHNPCNEHTRYYRNYNLFWDVLTDRLKENYNVIENRNFQFANVGASTIFLKKGLNPEEGLKILECEYIIEFEETGDFYVLSVSDSLTSTILNERSNPFLKKVLVSQFNKKELEHHVGKNIDKYEPWIYFQSQVYDLETIYNKRLSIVNFINKMYFRGTSLEDRSILSHINPEYLEGVRCIGGQEAYFEDLIKYKIGLSVGGRAEICYRDIEYMAIGVPFIRFNYLNELNPKLIPNYHYIAVERPNNLNLDRLGGPEHAKLIQDRFLQVKDDEEFLNFISKNARDYYEKYLSLNSSIDHTLNLLNFQEKNNDMNEDKDTDEYYEDIKRGLFSYNGIGIMQNPKISVPFLELFSQKKPSQILEIGTAYGGLTIFLRDLLDNLNLKDTIIRTHDLHSNNYILSHKNSSKIEMVTENLFASNYTKLVEEEKEKLINFIRKPGVTIVLCDGGSKKNEFNLLSEFLKEGDIIMAHDYAPSLEFSMEKMQNKIWNWHEILDADIEESCKKFNLTPFLQEEFLNVAWVCRQKSN